MAYVNLPDGRKISYVMKRARQATQESVQKVKEVAQNIVKEKYEAPEVAEDKTMRNAKMVALGIFALIVIILIYQRK